MKQEINKIIWDEIKKLKLDEKESEMLSDILFFERENIDQQSPRFKNKYCSIIEREY